MSSLSPFWLARHGRKNLLVYLHVSFFEVAWVGIVFWCLNVCINGYGMFAGNAILIPRPTATCLLDQINYMPLILTTYLIKETASCGSTKWLTFNLQFLQPILYAWTQLSSILLYVFPFCVKPNYKFNPNPLQHCQDRLVPRLQYHCIKRFTQIIYQTIY